MRGQRQRLAGVGHLGLQEVVEAAVDLVGHRVEQFRPFDHTHVAPVALERGARGADRGIHLAFARLVHQAQHPVVDGGVVLEGLAGSDELAVDEVQVPVHGDVPRKGEEKTSSGLGPGPRPAACGPARAQASSGSAEPPEMPDAADQRPAFSGRQPDEQAAAEDGQARPLHDADGQGLVLGQRGHPRLVRKPKLAAA